MSNDFMNLSKIKLKDYSSIFLKNNPFPMTLVPSNTPVFTADRSKERKHYEQKLAQLINNNGGFNNNFKRLLWIWKISSFIRNKKLCESKFI